MWISCVCVFMRNSIATAEPAVSIVSMAHRIRAETDKRIGYALTELFRFRSIMRGSDFAELKAFATVVERASFARAADHLGLSASALSQTIRQLETRLGVRLLNRTTRSVGPTEAGARLHERVAPLLQEFDAAVAEVMATKGRVAGTLRINTLGMAARSSSRRGSVVSIATIRTSCSTS